MLKESLDGGRIKGGMLKSHVEWLDEQRLPGGREALRSRVSAQTAQIVEGSVLPIVWYPFRALIETDRAIAALTGRPERATLIELGRHSARSNLGTSYRFFNRTQPHEFFESVARMHGQYVDFGRETYRSLGPTRCEIVLSDCACYSKAYCWSAIGYYEQATALQGGREPRVAESDCVCQGQAACRFEIAWS